MKKVNLARIWLTALWPLIFPLFVRCVEVCVQIVFSHTHEILYNWATMAAYAISGLIFAVNGFGRKENFKQKTALYAYSTAGIFAILLLALFLLNIKTGSFTYRIFSIMFYDLYNDWYLVFFSFAYTLYMSIKTVVDSARHSAPMASINTTK